MLKDTFCKLAVTCCQCIFGTENYPDSGILKNYDEDDSTEGSSQITEAVRALTKDDILQPYVSDDKFRSSNVRVDDIRYKLYVFDIRYQQNFIASQPIKVEFMFDGVVSNDLNGCVLVLTNKLISVSSNGKRQFDVI